MIIDSQTDFMIFGVTLNVALRALVLLVFVGLLLSAAIIDLWRFIIPNSIVVGLLGLWPIWIALSGDTALGATLLGAAVVFAVSIVFFALGYMGGGDAKLIAALSLWTGPVGLITLILAISVAGGLLSLFWLSSWRQRLAPAVGWTMGQRGNTQIPYGVAIAAGGLMLAGRLWTG